MAVHIYWRRPAVRGVRKNRYREATRTLQSGVPDNLRGCWSGLYPYAFRSKYQSITLFFIWQTFEVHFLFIEFIDFTVRIVVFLAIQA